MNKCVATADLRRSLQHRFKVTAEQGYPALAAVSAHRVPLMRTPVHYKCLFEGNF